MAQQVTQIFFRVNILPFPRPLGGKKKNSISKTGKRKTRNLHTLMQTSLFISFILIFHLLRILKIENSASKITVFHILLKIFPSWSLFLFVYAKFYLANIYCFFIGHLVSTTITQKKQRREKVEKR